MKTVNFAALVLIGAGFALESAPAAPLNVRATLNEFSGLVYATDKKSKKKMHNYSAAKGFIPGHVLTPYGYRDCIGWWELLSDSRMQCHGQLIKPK